MKRAIINDKGIQLVTGATTMKIAGMTDQSQMASVVRACMSKETVGWVESVTRVFGGVAEVREYESIDEVQGVRRR